MGKPIALVLGSGANLGSHVASRLRSDGYRVATVSRSKASDKDEENLLTLKGDFADPKEVGTVFATVRKAWGEPSVVVYNGTSPPTASKQILQTLSLSLSLSFSIATANTGTPQRIVSLTPQPPNPLSTSQRKTSSGISRSTQLRLSLLYARP
jgi:NAD(P)-dependent dehydrogenase (short-subunit alcohol dehydrogenase family)